MISTFYLTGVFVTYLIIFDLPRVRHAILISFLWPAFLVAILIHDLVYIFVTIFTRND